MNDEIVTSIFKHNRYGAWNGTLHLLMSYYRRANTKGGTYFFTVVTYRRQRILWDEMVRNALREGIKAIQATHPFAIDAWVLLPDHLHCIWTLPFDDADFGVRWAMIKRYATKKCGPELKRDEWMSPSKLNERDYEKHMDYVHYNPVKHGLVEKVAEWPHSTFHRYVQQGVYNMDWAGAANDPLVEDFGEP